MKKLLNSACFTDIHFGRKNNSEIHNQDCLDYIDWFIGEINNVGNIDNIIFIGDWFEHRQSINGLTLDYSIRAAKQLNDLGIPIYMIVGNHDLYYRNKRDIFMSKIFESFDNITVVNKPTVVKELGTKGSLICPYLFHNEYDKLLSYMDTPIWFGHLEFNGFVLTGEHVVMQNGTDSSTFKSIKHIFCGHFHKRQHKDNVDYIGNTFPADFSDANDFERGCMLYDHSNDIITYKNWDDCPKYVKTVLTEMEESPDDVLFNNARVECLVDRVITFEEFNSIKEKYSSEYNLRELRLTESNELDELLTESDDIGNIEELNKLSTPELIKELISTIKSDTIDNSKLTKIYDKL